MTATVPPSVAGNDATHESTTVARNLHRERRGLELPLVVGELGVVTRRLLHEVLEDIERHAELLRNERLVFSQQILVVQRLRQLGERLVARHLLRQDETGQVRLALVVAELVRQVPRLKESCPARLVVLAPVV